jgi:uncharacterized protein
MFWAALILGIGGSLHCLGMCGPIVMAVSSGRGKTGFEGAFLYNTGRILTYTLLGLFFGLAGFGIRLAVMQNSLSLAAGLFLIAMGLSALVGWKWKYGHRLTGRFVHKGLSRLFKKQSIWRMLPIGMLNGLLPCGMVYMALIPALALGQPGAGAAFMFVFGLGTVPMLFALAMLKGRMPEGLRFKFNRITPVITLVIGVLFSLRGMELGIPYLSPKTAKMENSLDAAANDELVEEFKSCH